MSDTETDIVSWSSRAPAARRAAILTADTDALPYACFFAEQVLQHEQARDYDIVIGLTDGAAALSEPGS